MAKKTNWKQKEGGKEYYKINRKVGMKLKDGVWVDDYKCFYGSCKSEAEQKYNDYMKSLQNNAASPKACLGEVIDEWINKVFKNNDLKNSSKAKYLRDYNKIFKESKDGLQLIGRPIESVTPLQIQEVYNNCDRCYSSIRSAHNLLVHFFKYADLNGICRNLTTSLQVPKKPAKRSDIEEIEVWEDESLKKVIASLDGNTLRLLVVFAVNTGARFSELLALTYDDIRDGMLYITKQLADAADVNSEDGKKTVLHIEETKTESSNRVIPLSAPVMAEVEKHRKLQAEEMKKYGYETNYLFTTSNGTFYYKRNVARSLDRLYKRIGVQPHKFHAYRHTFGTNLSRAGVPIEETSKLMGHSDISMTAKYYVYVDAERRRAAVDKIVGYSLDQPESSLNASNSRCLEAEAPKPCGHEINANGCSLSDDCDKLMSVNAQAGMLKGANYA